MVPSGLTSTRQMLLAGMGARGHLRKAVQPSGFFACAADSAKIETLAGSAVVLVISSVTPFSLRLRTLASTLSKTKKLLFVAA